MAGATQVTPLAPHFLSHPPHPSPTPYCLDPPSPSVSPQTPPPLTGQPDAQYVFPLTLVAQCIGLPLGSILQKKIGERYSLLLGSWLMASGVFLSS